MKNQKKKQVRKPVRKSRRTVTTVVIACVVVLAAAITVISRQVAKSNAAKTAETQVSTTDAAKKFVTMKVAGRDVQVDAQTGQIKPMTPQEAQRLADGLKTMLNKSTDGLVPVQHEDGSVSMDLQGRFQHVTVARINEDGSVEKECIDEPLQAARFFGIDPKLLGAQSKADSAQAVVRTPAKKVSK